MRATRTALALTLLIASSGFIGAANANGGAADTIRGCVQKASGQLRILSDGDACRAAERSLDWSAAGGPAGPPGPAATDGLREIHVTLPSSVGWECHLPDWQAAPAFRCPVPDDDLAFASVDVDASRYPDGTTFSFRAGVVAFPGTEYCVRLYDVVTRTAVEGSEACVRTPPGGADAAQPFRLDGTAALDARAHRLTVQTKDVSGRALYLHSRLVATW